MFDYYEQHASDMWASLVLEKHSVIDGRNVWFFSVNTSIGDIQIVQYETEGREIIEKMFRRDYAKAEKHFTAISAKMVAGKI